MIGGFRSICAFLCFKVHCIRSHVFKKCSKFYLSSKFFSSSLCWNMASWDSQDESVPIELPNAEETQICEGENMWKWTGMFPPTFTFAASACLYYRLYLTNTVDATVTVTKPKWLFWQDRFCVIGNSCKWGPWATNNKILVRTLLYISRFLLMSFCKGYSSRFNTSPSQFSLLEFLYMISLASKSLIVYVLDDCQIWNAVWQNNTSIVCYLNLLKESFPYNSG